MPSRGAWFLAILALGAVGALLVTMARSLDVKQPVRLPPRETPAEAPTAVPLAPEEVAAHEEVVMRSLVARRAAALAPKAAAQAFSPEDLPNASCAYRSAELVHRDGDTAFWRLEYACADARKPGDLPDLVGLSVKVRRDGERWLLEE